MTNDRRKQINAKVQKKRDREQKETAEKEAEENKQNELKLKQAGFK